MSEGAFWSRWVARANEREPALPLALLRAAAGLVLASTLASMLSSGIIDAAWVRPEEGGFRVATVDPWLFRAIGGASRQAVRGVCWAGLVAATLVALGLGGRASSLAALLASQALFDLDRSSGGGHDLLICNSLWLLTLGDGAATLSLDERLRRGSWVSDRAVWAAPRRLAALQLGAMYFTAGVHKVGVEWMPSGGFSALYYALQAPHYQRIDMRWAASLYPLTQIGTAATMALEVLAPLWLLVFVARGGLTGPRALGPADPRLWLVALGAGMHAGIWATMDVGPFSAISLAYYPCLFSADELGTLARRARALARRGE